MALIWPQGYLKLLSMKMLANKFDNFYSCWVFKRNISKILFTYNQHSTLASSWPWENGWTDLKVHNMNVLAYCFINWYPCVFFKDCFQNITNVQFCSPILSQPGPWGNGICIYIIKKKQKTNKTLNEDAYILISQPVGL